ncbi:hypothetical protein C2S52_014220 [Perilla frutescens var. hirtella]|nr:hypothetical protein C2S52_014220 [Perilla frutescens var. hirtella]
MTSAFSWIKADETAAQALVRILTERPFLVLPAPLHRLPLRVGNVVEIVGPSPSAKTLILIQAAINCILPKEWKGGHYGGLERAVMFIDLDCRFDVSSLSRALQRRIIEANGLRSSLKGNVNEIDKELFVACMSRLQQEKEKRGSAVYMLLIDSIGAFYWMDRALPSSSTGKNNRKSLSLQTVVETVVHEIQRLMAVHPILVLSTKSAAFGDKQSTTEVIRKRSNEKIPVSRGSQNTSHRDFMPSVWQSFVSHRLLLRASDGISKHQNHPTFSTEWLLPSLKSLEHFTVDDDGVLVTI